MRAGIYYEILIITVLKENAFMTDSLERKLQVSSARVSDTDKLIHYLRWEGCLYIYSWSICMVCESEPREMNVLYGDLGLDVQTQFFRKGLNL